MTNIHVNASKKITEILRLFKALSGSPRRFDTFYEIIKKR